MKLVILVVGLIHLTVACASQSKIKNLEWKEFVSKEANFKIDAPCELDKTVKSFQEEPQPMRIYGFSCERDGNKYLISFKDHFSEFNKDKLAQELEDFDDFLKEQYAATLKSVKGETVTRNGLTARVTELEFKNGNRIKRIFTKDKRGTYDAMIGVFKKDNQSQKAFLSEYETLSARFINSFQVIGDEK